MQRRRRIGWLLAATMLLQGGLVACGPKRVGTVPAAFHAPTRMLPCHGPEGVVAWKRAETAEDGEDDSKLDLWCTTVGAPVITHVEQPAGTVTRLLILNWNVGVGAGRIADVVTLIRSRVPPPPSGDVGVIILLQEAFRGGVDVPDRVPPGLEVPGAIRKGRPTMDIVGVARALGLSLAYVPSMRNGPATSVDEREDRGNAVLSTEPLSDVTAIELPFAKQRRVAVMATVTPRGTTAPLRVIAGHLDTPFRGTIRQAKRLRDFIASTASVPPTVLGIDTNAILGRFGRTVNALEDVLRIAPGCEGGRTGPWPFGRLDFIFDNLSGRTVLCETFTDNHGSDHVPALLTIDF